MLKVFALVIFAWGMCAWADESLLLNKLTEKSARQKRLLCKFLYFAFFLFIAVFPKNISGFYKIVFFLKRF